jgi:hypothetical protein
MNQIWRHQQRFILPIRNSLLLRLILRSRLFCYPDYAFSEVCFNEWRSGCVPFGAGVHCLASFFGATEVVP